MKVRQLIERLMDLEDMDGEIYIQYGHRETGYSQYIIECVIADSDGEHLLATGYEVER